MLQQIHDLAVNISGKRWLTNRLSENGGRSIETKVIIVNSTDFK